MLSCCWRHRCSTSPNCGQDALILMVKAIVHEASRRIERFAIEPH
jgi:hypothetical protein